jgi:PEP-CTERM motif
MTISSRLGTLGLGCATMFFWASAPAEAISITSVVVTANLQTYNALLGWSFPVSLSNGQDLVLTQDFQGAPDGSASYNFDTSDNPPGAGSNIPRIDITADGVTTSFFDVLQVLNVKNQGSVSLNSNEAQNYGLPLVGPGYQVFLGYADNVHPGSCGVYAASLGLAGSLITCFPAPFDGPTVFRFEGTGALVPIDPTTGQLVQEPNDGVHCSSALHNCYDAGVIRIVATPVPEPATISLLLMGLAALTARRYGQARTLRSENREARK